MSLFLFSFLSFNSFAQIGLRTSHLSSVLSPLILLHRQRQRALGALPRCRSTPSYSLLGSLCCRRLAGMVFHHCHQQKQKQNTFSQSLNTGRPPSFSLAYIDCRFPQYDHSNIDNKGTACTFLPIHFPPLPSSPHTSVEIWQFRFAAECVADVTSRTLTAHAPSYTTIMELDRKIRQFPLPEGLCNPPPNNDLSATFMRCVLDHIKETGTHPPFLP